MKQFLDTAKSTAGTFTEGNREKALQKTAQALNVLVEYISQQEKLPTAVHFFHHDYIQDNRFGIDIVVSVPITQNGPEPSFYMERMFFAEVQHAQKNGYFQMETADDVHAYEDFAFAEFLHEAKKLIAKKQAGLKTEMQALMDILERLNITKEEGEALIALPRKINKAFRPYKRTEAAWDKSLLNADYLRSLMETIPSEEAPEKEDS